MHLSNRTTGLGLAGLGAVAITGALRLPAMLGQAVGPSVFPIVVGVGLMVCGALIALGVGQSFEEEAAPEVSEAVHPLHGLRPIIPIAALLLYAIAADTVGFAPVASVMVFGVAYALGAKPWQAVALALAATPFVHLVFAKLLRVPLPAGLLPMPW